MRGCEAAGGGAAGGEWVSDRRWSIVHTNQQIC